MRTQIRRRTCKQSWTRCKRNSGIAGANERSPEKAGASCACARGCGCGCGSSQGVKAGKDLVFKVGGGEVQLYGHADVSLDDQTNGMAGFINGGLPSRATMVGFLMSPATCRSSGFVATVLSATI